MLNFYSNCLIFLGCFYLLLNPAMAFQSPKWNEQKVVHLLRGAKKNILSNPGAAYSQANEALIGAKALYLHEEEAKANFLLGLIFYHQGVYLEASTHLLQVEQFYRAQPLPALLAETLNYQGLVQYNSKQPDLALEKHREALDIFKELNDAAGLAATFGWIGRQYEKRRAYDLALKFNREALGLYTELQDTSGIATILENIGSIYEDREDYGFAMEYFRKSLSHNQSMQDSIFMILNLNNIGDIYRKTSQFDSALHYSSQALRLSQRLNDNYQISSAFKDLSKTYLELGDFEKAFHYLDSGRRVFEMMYSDNMSKQLGILQTLFETERKSNEIMQLEQARRTDWILNISMLLILILSTAIAYFIIHKQRYTLLQQKKLHEAEKKLMLTDLENKMLFEKQLKQEIESKAKSLTADSLRIIGKNQILEDVKAKLKATLDTEPAQIKKSIRNLIKMIDFNFSEDKGWDDFKQVFEQIHQDFFDQLGQTYPDLSPAEIRLAALIKINLPTKDISNILGISTESLRTSKYRLKKKLRLGTDESLSHFILSI